MAPVGEQLLGAYRVGTRSAIPFRVAGAIVFDISVFIAHLDADVDVQEIGVL